MITKDDEKKKIDSRIIDEVIDAVLKMRHGEVVITVYDSKIVQIQKTEKKRFK